MSVLKRLLGVFGLAGAGIALTAIVIIAYVLFYGLIIFGILWLLELLGVNVPFLMLALA